MAADKKTLLRDALKQVQSGKIDKAIETYKAVAKIDPRDATVKNTLGDLYIKLGRKKDAIAEYLEASSLYEKDGFAMRSIAICQKVANLDPTMLSVRVKLGDLYAGLKLPAEARAQYLLVADASDKKGDVATALEIFRKLADLDPANLPVRVKLGGMFEKQKQPDKAADEYVRAAKGYVEKKDLNTAAQLCVRAFKLSPANVEARRWLADHYAQRQDWSVVVGLLETPARKGSRDVGLLLLYAEALTRVNHPREAVGVLEPALEREPNSIPLSLGLGRAYLKTEEIEKGLTALNRGVNAHLAENRLEQAETLLREMAAAAPQDDKVFQRLLEVAQKRGDKGAIAKAYFQLADLYENKGLVRSATGIIEKYLEAHPGDEPAQQRLKALRALTPAPKIEAPPPPPPPASAPAPALAPPSPHPGEEGVELDLEGEDFATIEIPAEEEELVLEFAGEETEEFEATVAEPESVADARALIRRGAAAKASSFLEEHLGADPSDVEAWRALIDARRQLDDRSGLRDAFLRLADLHRKNQRFNEAREAFTGALDVDPRSAAAQRGLADLVLAQEAATPSAPLEPPPPPPPPEEEEYTLDFSEELEAPIELPEPEPVGTEPAVPAAAPAPTAEEEFFVDFTGELEKPAEPAVPAAVATPAPPPAVEEEFALDFTEEPVAALESPPAPQVAGPPAQPPEPAIEEVAPGDLGEFAAFEDILQVEPEALPSPPSPPPEAASPPSPTSQPVAAGPAPSRSELEEFMAEAEFYLQQGLIDEAEFLYSKLLRIAPDNPEVAAQLLKIGQMRAPAPSEPATDERQGFEADLERAFGAVEALPATVPPAAAASVDFQGFLDELRQEVESEVDFGQQPSLPPPEQGEEGLAAIFQEFQRSVKDQLGDEDFETHYNLGIAYKEMSLTDEAIGEFTLAERSPTRRLDAVSMIALCLREIGRFDEAAIKLRTGISLATEGSEEQKGFLYDLAALHEQAGRTSEAQEALQRLWAMDPSYRDVAARVSAAPPSAPRSKKSKISYL